MTFPIFKCLGNPYSALLSTSTILLCVSYESFNHIIHCSIWSYSNLRNTKFIVTKFAKKSADVWNLMLVAVLAQTPFHAGFEGDKH